METEFQKNENFIYKFVPFSLNSLKMLIKGEIYFGIPHNLNDPFEGEFTLEDFDLQLDDEWVYEIYKEIFEYSEREIKDRLVDFQKDRNVFREDISSYVKKILKETHGVSCFSTIPNSIRMWSHYADAHKGMCLVFDKDELLNSLNNIYKGVQLTPINYCENLPSVKPIINGRHLRFQNIENIFTCKFEEWKSEGEIRLQYSFEGLNAHRNIRFDKKSLKGIITGEKMSEDDLNTLVHFFANDRSYKINWGKAEKDFVNKNIKLLFANYFLLGSPDIITTSGIIKDPMVV